MSELESSNKATELPQSEKHSVSWRTLGLRILGLFILFIAVCEILFPVRIGWYAKQIVGFIVYYVTYFTFHVAPPLLIAFLIARLPPRNRKRPLPQFLNKALIPAILIMGVMIYFRWFGESLSK